MQGGKAFWTKQQRYFPDDCAASKPVRWRFDGLRFDCRFHCRANFQAVNKWGGGTCKNIDPIPLWAVTPPSMPVSHWLWGACQVKSLGEGGPFCSSFASIYCLLLKRCFMWEIIRGNFVNSMDDILIHSLQAWSLFSAAQCKCSLFSQVLPVI